MKKLKCIAISFLLCLSMCFCLPTIVSAKSLENSISSRAISGSNAMFVSQGTTNSFTLYSPGWSAVGHAKIEVQGANSNNLTVVSVKPQSGNGDTAYINGNGTVNMTLYFAPAGTYTITASTSTSNSVVSVYLGDGAHY